MGRFHPAETGEQTTTCLAQLKITVCTIEAAFAKLK